MPRRPSTPSVTLFPFLAVLVCTMGALIFLLLVTTRRIQKQVDLPVASIEMVDLDEELEPAIALPLQMTEPVVVDQEPEVELDPEEPILPLLAGNTWEDHEWLRAEWEAQERRRLLFYQKKVDERDRKQQELNLQLDTQLASIRQQILLREAELKELLERMSVVEKQVELDAQAAEQNNQERERLQKALNDVNLAIEQEKRERFRLQNLAADYTRQIARLEEEQSQALPETEIVAYDSLTGTARKPILIECRESEIIFASEGIVLSAEVLSGFPPEFNPLLAGAEALLNYWSQNGDSAAKPYILLVVRPQGTVGFYVARGLLSELDHSFGYELVEHNTAIRWPASDPGAVAACQEAVFKVLGQRDRVAAKAGRLATLKNGPLSYSDGSGSFQLPEMKSMQRSSQGSFLDDERWMSPRSRGAQRTPQPPGPPQMIARPSPSQTLLQSPQRQQAIPSQTADSTPGQVPQTLLGDTPARSNGQQQIYDLRKQNNSQNSSMPQRLPEFPSAKKMETDEAQPLFADNPFEDRQSSGKPSTGSGKESYGIQIPKPRGVIGIERETEIHLWSNNFKIDDGTSLAIPENAAPADVSRAVRDAVSAVTSTWDDPPKSYFWKPVVKIVIHPGGIMHYARVKELVDQWEIPTTIEYEIQ